MASINDSINIMTALYRNASIKITKQIRNGVTDARKSQLQKVQAQVDAELARLEKRTKKAVDEENEKHYSSCFMDVVKQLSTAGLPDSDSFSVLDKDAIEVMAQETFSLFGESIKGMSNSSKRILGEAKKIRIQALITDGKITGETRKQISGAISDLIKEDFIALVDKGGKKWKPETYARMLTRTKMTESTNLGLTNRLARDGYDLVQISTHPGSRKEHVPAQGQVVSLSGKTSVNPVTGKRILSLDEITASYNLFGPNCRHRLLPYHPQFKD